MTELIKSLIQFQSEVGSIPKNKVNPYHHNKYADLASILNVVTPILTKNGLCISQTSRVENETTTLVTTLYHESGQSITSEYILRETKTEKQEIAIDEKTKQQSRKKIFEYNSQSLAASMTYARRYCLCAILNITAEDDDDGNYASGLHNQQPQKQSAPSNGNGNGKQKELGVCPACKEPKLMIDRYDSQKKYCLGCGKKFDLNMKEIVKVSQTNEQQTFGDDDDEFPDKHNPDPLPY